MFRYFDINSRGYLYEDEFKRGLEGLGIQVPSDLKLVYQRYDKDGDGTIKFSEFTHMLLPLNEEIKERIMSKKPKNLEKRISESYFIFEVKECLQRLLNQLIEGEQSHFQ